MGDISLWEASSREKLASRSFQVWDIGTSSILSKVRSLFKQFRKVRSKFMSSEPSYLLTVANEFQVALAKDPSVSVRRILWTPDGNIFGELEDNKDDNFC